MKDAAARVHLVVSGRVQGVFYRRFAQAEARELGLTGWAQNIGYGRVEIVCEGEKEKVEQFVEWCKQGPPLAKIENVEVEYGEYQGKCNDFEIREFGL